MLNFRILLALILFPTVSWSACNCGSVDSATPCTGQSISVTVTDKKANDPQGVDSIFNWAFNSGGGDARCGQFANGDYWIAPAPGQSSVTITAITSNGTVSADVNPVSGNFGLGDGSNGYAGYSAAQNIISSLPQSYSVMTSIVAAVTRDEITYPNCGSQLGECIDSYHVVSILTAVPEKAGSETIRPSINGTKELVTYDDFDFTRLPAFSFMTGTDAAGLADIKRRWSHSIEIFSFYWSLDNGTTWTGPSSEGGRAYRSFNLVDDYGGGIGRSITMDIGVMMSDYNSLAEKKPALAAILTYGSDLYHAFFEPVSGQKTKWGSGAGQHVGKITAPLLFAALSVDNKYYDNIYAISGMTRDYFPQEMKQLHLGVNGVVWGDRDSLIYGQSPAPPWSATKRGQCYDGAPGTCITSLTTKAEADPHLIIDGPMAKPGSQYFLQGYAGEINLGGIMLAMPRARAAMNYEAIIDFVDRVRTHGILTMPDPCVTPDDREDLTNCNALNGDNCLYYSPFGSLGNTWGPTTVTPLYQADACVTTVIPGHNQAGRFASLDGTAAAPTSSYVSNAFWGTGAANWLLLKALDPDPPPDPPALSGKRTIGGMWIKSIPNNN